MSSPKEAFLNSLRKKLSRLPQEEIDSALAYYEEYLEEAGEEHLEETLRELGSPREIAAQILADRAAKELDEGAATAKKGLSAVWVVVLAIFASPIALPLAAVAAALVLVLALVVFLLIFVLLLLFFCLVVAFGAVAFACVLTGVVFICLSIPLAFLQVPTGVFYFGMGLTAAGLGVLSGLFVTWFARWCWSFSKHLLTQWLPDLARKVLPRKAVAQ